MCDICGCDDDAVPTAMNLQTGKPISLDSHSHQMQHRRALATGHGHLHEHVHSDGTRHVHAHHGPHHHAAPSGLVDIETRILAKNDALAADNRAWLAEQQVLAINLMGAPGAGKTALLERTIRDIGAQMSLFVLEGDQATLNDGERIRAAGAPVIQVNTGTGCHLDADMLARSMKELHPTRRSIMVIENVGNLVCPALFDLGERRRVVVLSATEGDDKPLKYPHMFRAADLVLLNKIDLLPYVEFDAVRAIANARSLNPDVSVMRVSARTGEGLPDWYDWLQLELRNA